MKKERGKMRVKKQFGTCCAHDVNKALSLTADFYLSLSGCHLNEQQDPFTHLKIINPSYELML